MNPRTTKLSIARSVGLLVLTSSMALMSSACDWLDANQEQCDQLDRQRRELLWRGDEEFLGDRRQLVSLPVSDEPAFVGPDGNDTYGYPLRQPDKISILRLLRARRFDDLDRWMTYLQDQFAADPRKEYWPDNALSAFFNPDPELAPILDEWIERHPESFAAWAARANYGLAGAMQTRGPKFVREVPLEDIVMTTLECNVAIDDMERALELRPDFVAGRDRLIFMHKLAGDGHTDSRQHLDAAIKSCRGCYNVRATYLYFLTPKWGSSRVAMEAYASGLRRLFDEFPRLRMLGGFAEHARCEDLTRREPEQALEACDAALEHGQEPEFLLGKARALGRLERRSEAVLVLDHALQLSPQDRQVLLLRSAAYASSDLRRTARDLVPLLELGHDFLDPKFVEGVVVELGRQARDLMQQRRYDEAATYIEPALELHPDNGPLRGLQASIDKVRDPSALVQRAMDDPDDLGLRIRADYALAAAGRTREVLPLWADFIERHPSVARAYRERAGAHHNLGQREAELADLVRACELGSEIACSHLELYELGCPPYGDPEHEALLRRSILLGATAVVLFISLLLLRRRRTR